MRTQTDTQSSWEVAILRCVHCVFFAVMILGKICLQWFGRCYLYYHSFPIPFCCFFFLILLLLLVWINLCSHTYFRMYLLLAGNLCRNSFTFKLAVGCWWICLLSTYSVLSIASMLLLFFVVNCCLYRVISFVCSGIFIIWLSRVYMMFVAC